MRTKQKIVFVKSLWETLANREITEMENKIITDPNYWDCECRDKYIHLKARLQKCKRCSTRHQDQPDSRINEIKAFYDINEGWR